MIEKITRRFDKNINYNTYLKETNKSVEKKKNIILKGLKNMP